MSPTYNLILPLETRINSISGGYTSVSEIEKLS